MERATDPGIGSQTSTMPAMVAAMARAPSRRRTRLQPVPHRAAVTARAPSRRRTRVRPVPHRAAVTARAPDRQPDQAAAAPITEVVAQVPARRLRQAPPARTRAAAALVRAPQMKHRPLLGRAALAAPTAQELSMRHRRPLQAVARSPKRLPLPARLMRPRHRPVEPSMKPAAQPPVAPAERSTKRRPRSEAAAPAGPPRKQPAQLGRAAAVPAVARPQVAAAQRPPLRPVRSRTPEAELMAHRSPERACCWLGWSHSSARPRSSDGKSCRSSCGKAMARKPSGYKKRPTVFFVGIFKGIRKL